MCTINTWAPLNLCSVKGSPTLLRHQHTKSDIPKSSQSLDYRTLAIA